MDRRYDPICGYTNRAMQGDHCGGRWLQRSNGGSSAAICLKGVVSTKNQGAAAARNHALHLSRGDYIQWLDADDLLSPDRIDRQLAPLRGVTAVEYLFPRRGATSTIGPTAHGSSRLPCGKTFLLSVGPEEDGRKPATTWLTRRELAEAAGSWATGLLEAQKKFRRVKGYRELEFLHHRDELFVDSAGASRVTCRESRSATFQTGDNFLFRQNQALQGSRTAPCCVSTAPGQPCEFVQATPSLHALIVGSVQIACLEFHTAPSQ
jgi:hypothetical protein